MSLRVNTAKMTMQCATGGLVKTSPWIGVLVILVTLVAPVPSVQADRITTFVSILPQVYFVERVGGPWVEVHPLVGPGRSPATYEPSPKQMSRLSQSRLYFRIGVPFEETLVPKISRLFKNLKIIDTRRGVKLRFFKGAHGSQAPDPHIWLDPKRVKTQAGTICEALVQIIPESAPALRQNLQTFLADLDRVDAEITGILAPVKGGRFFVFHPAFGYFADSYGLTQVPIEMEGKTPSPRQLAMLIERARRKHVKVIFMQPQYAKKDAKTIAKAIGGAVVPIDPLAPDYMANLRRIAAAIKKGLSRGEGR